jgi:hypothetical protein
MGNPSGWEGLSESTPRLDKYPPSGLATPGTPGIFGRKRTHRAARRHRLRRMSRSRLGKRTCLRSRSEQPRADGQTVRPSRATTASRRELRDCRNSDTTARLRSRHYRDSPAQKVASRATGPATTRRADPQTAVVWRAGNGIEENGTAGACRRRFTAAVKRHGRRAWPKAFAHFARGQSPTYSFAGPYPTSNLSSPLLTPVAFSQCQMARTRS